MSMGKTFKTAFIVGIVLTLVGGATFTAAIGATGWNFDELSTTQFEEKTYTETDAVTTLNVDYESANVQTEFVPAGSALTVRYPQRQNKNGENTAAVTVTEESGVLTVSEKSNFTAQLFAWNWTAPTVVLSLPADRVYTLNLQTDNGDVRLGAGDYSVGSLSIESNNGDLHLEDANVTVQDSVTVSTDNGEIYLGSVTAREMNVHTNNGEIELQAVALTGNFSCKSNNGKILLKESVHAANIRVETNNGEICANGCLQANDITLDSDVGSITALVYGTRADYTLTVSTDVGISNLTSSTGGAKTLTVTTDVGSINVRFSGE